ncbi:MAG: hypothetical protein KatS3mg056_2540 [Chloroflexus sp.]|nr:MAG: hypothetical protein KatS3mg056_2540 [Chloroflexus sp.]
MRNSWLRQHWPLLLALGAGIGLRLALWGNLPRLGLISDEAEYLASADWLANGRGFAWHTTYLWTRAPLYPLFLAAHIALFGRNEAFIFVTQNLLSLVNVGLVYVLSRQLGATSRMAGGAALLSALSLPLAMYPQLLLSETLFISLLLAAFCLLANPRQRRNLLIGGVLLGLATLTRGLLLGFLPLIAGWIGWRTPGHWRERLISGLLPLLAAGCLIGPWAFYASRTYGGLIIIDTTSAYNLALGARTAYDGGRSDAPTRNLVLALLDPTLDDDIRAQLTAGSCLAERNDPRLAAALAKPVTAITQAERQHVLSAEGWCLIQAKPWAFGEKTFAELIDLFQINYSGDERLAEGFALGRLPAWYTLALLVLDDTLYVIVLPLAVLGWAVLRRPQSTARRADWLVAVVQSGGGAAALRD